MGLTIEDKYVQLCTTPSDINEHLPTLRKYASECSSIVEMGVRAIVSTWALLAGMPRKMLSIDIVNPNDIGANLQEVYSACAGPGIEFTFIKSNTFDIVIGECDLLFLDTLHTYEHVKKELALHGNKARKYIIIHDTMHNPPMFAAITKFVQDNPWCIREVFTNNNGLVVLRRAQVETV
jgi:hypothetical protein